MPAVVTAPLPPMARPVGSAPPQRTRVLFVATAQRVGSWLTDALAAESPHDHWEEVVGGMAGLSRLRDEVFDAVLASHVPHELDALAFLHAARTGGSEEPVIILGQPSEQELAPAAFEAGAEAYVCVNSVTSRTLGHLTGRAVERHRLLRENRRLTQNERQRLDREHVESQHLLDDLAAITTDLERLQPGRGVTAPSLPAELHAHYRELVRAHVIMGSGNLAEEVFALAELLTSAGVGPRHLLEMHRRVLEESVTGLGNRSSRHVMTRAGLLILELVAHLAEGYRERYRERQFPPRQLLLPGFAAA